MQKFLEVTNYKFEVPSIIRLFQFDQITPEEVFRKYFSLYPLKLVDLKTPI